MSDTIEPDIEKGYVYILSNKKGSVLYTGSTNNLKKRIYHHKHRLISGFSKKYNLDKLVYFEALTDMNKARAREKQIKGKTRAKKDVLIKASNANFLDLTSNLD